MNAVVKQGNALPAVGYLALSVPVHRWVQSDLQKPCSAEM
jgi:hypothetical protein